MANPEEAIVVSSGDSDDVLTSGKPAVATSGETSEQAQTVPEPQVQKEEPAAAAPLVVEPR